MHAIAWGRRLMGKVDAVPGVCHVAIQFWMFCYLPLIPLRTWIITDEVRAGLSGVFTGVPTSFSIKSYLMAWWRTLLGLVFAIAILSAVVISSFYFTGGKGIDFDGLCQCDVIAVLVTLLLFLPYWIPGIGRATASRAEQLKQALADAASKGGLSSPEPDVISHWG